MSQLLALLPGNTLVRWNGWFCAIQLVVGLLLNLFNMSFIHQKHCICYLLLCNKFAQT